MPLMDIKTLGTPLVSSDFTRQKGINRLIRRDNEQAILGSSEEIRVSVISKKHLSRLLTSGTASRPQLERMEGV